MERDKYASKRALRVTNVALIILLIIVLLFWWRGSSNFQFKGVNPGQISIRQQDGKIQYQFLDGEWQDITSVASLKGEKGADGKDGQDGKNGIDGKNGVNGLNGSNGTNGVNGIDGKNGLNGAQGIQGQKGDRGEKGEQGAQGNNGQDGREIEIRKDALYIQWRYRGDSNWNNLIAYSDLKGEKGDKGDTGPKGEKGEQGIQGAQGTKGEKGDTGAKGEQGIQGIQGNAGVGIPQTLSLNNGILSLSHGGGSIALPNNNLGAYSVFRMTSADTSNVFASGRLAREFDANRNYMVINNATGQGFIHVDFWASSVSDSKQILSLPANAPTPKELSEVQLFDGGSVWIVPGAKNVQIQGLSPNRRYVNNIPVMVEPIK
nr:MAG TPA: collagen triple helix repeat protein [Caudoviricetes sp.]